MRLSIPGLLIPFLVAGAALAQGRLEIEPKHLDLGPVDAAKDPVPFTFTIRNTGNEDLNLQWVETSCSCAAGNPQRGILAPGAVTKLNATFDPRRFNGPYRGRLEVHADGLIPIAEVTFQAQIRPDVEPTTTVERKIVDVRVGQSRTYAPEVVFEARSGTPFDSPMVTVQPNAPFLGARISVKDHRVTVIPYIEPGMLPKTLSGKTTLNVIFRAASVTTYTIPVEWRRADPVRITALPNGRHQVSFEDQAVKVLKVIGPKDFRFTATRAKDGHSVLIAPAPLARQRKGKKGPLIVPTLPTGSTVHLLTNHPTRPDVTISL